MNKIEIFFARLFSKSMMWFVRIGIILGAIMCVIYATYVVNNVPDWDFIDFCNMPGYWLWAEGFLQIGIPYLILCHILRFFMPNIDAVYYEYKAHKTSVFSLLLFSPHLWALFHPVKEDYARQYYYNKKKPYHETALDICHRIKVENYRKYCNAAGVDFSFSDADREIIREEKPFTTRRTEEAQAIYRKDIEAHGDYMGWNGWKDAPGDKGKCYPNESIAKKYNRLHNAGRL